MELIDLKDMVPHGNQVAVLVDDARLAEEHEVAGIGEGHLRLKLIA